MRQSSEKEKETAVGGDCSRMGEGGKRTSSAQCFPSSLSVIMFECCMMCRTSVLKISSYTWQGEGKRRSESLDYLGYLRIY
jgi:hypothetical protein